MPALARLLRVPTWAWAFRPFNAVWRTQTAASFGSAPPNGYMGAIAPDFFALKLVLPTAPGVPPSRLFPEGEMGISQR